MQLLRTTAPRRSDRAWVCRWVNCPYPALFPGHTETVRVYGRSKREAYRKYREAAGV